MDVGLGSFSIWHWILLLVFVVAAWRIFRRFAKNKSPPVSDMSQKPETSIHGPSASASSNAIFISYRHSDSGDVTGRIYDRLAQHFGKDKIFKDVDSIPLGVDFRSHLADSVGRCSVLLAVLGTRWAVQRDATDEWLLDNTRDFVRIEIESALERHVPIIPVLVQGAKMPSERELPEKLRSFAYHNAIAVRPDPDFHQDCARLIKGIEFHISGKFSRA